jgi:glycosyltransferase involved in cell wall biosynthesis
MKVILDVSKFGAFDPLSSSKTGVFRVVENLARGLRNAQDCDLSFHISLPSYTPYYALTYLKSSEFNQIPVVYQTNPIQSCLYQAHRLINSNIRSTSASNSHSQVTQTSLTALRKLVTGVYRATEPFCQELDPQVLNEADIYHSPFEPIPSTVQVANRLRKFLTVHDLIPVLLPHLFEEGASQSFETEILGSITPDTWVLCVSESTKNDLCNYSSAIDPSRVLVTHLAASDLFYPCTDAQAQATIRQKYDIPDAPYILSLSTLEPRKNIEHVIRSFSNLIQQEKINDLHLVLVGPKGWNYDSIFAEITSNPKLRDRIILTGFVDDADLAAIYSGALAFVYMSLYEGFGLPPLEAMKCGIPVITSNTSSLPEVVGNAGILLNPTDSDGLQQSLLSLYNNASLRAKLSQRSLEHSQTFSWEKCVQETISAYKLALSS